MISQYLFPLLVYPIFWPKPSFLTVLTFSALVFHHIFNSPCKCSIMEIYIQRDRTTVAVIRSFGSLQIRVLYLTEWDILFKRRPSNFGTLLQSRHAYTDALAVLSLTSASESFERSFKLHGLSNLTVIGINVFLARVNVSESLERLILCGKHNPNGRLSFFFYRVWAMQASKWVFHRLEYCSEKLLHLYDDLYFHCFSHVHFPTSSFHYVMFPWPFRCNVCCAESYMPFVSS